MQKIQTFYLLMIPICLISTLISLFLIKPQEMIPQEVEFYSLDYYGFVYIIFWGFVMDLDLLFTRHTKNSVFYINNHILFSLLSFFCLFLANLTILGKQLHQNKFFYREIFITFIEIISFTLGYRSFLRLKQNSLYKSSISQRKIHIVLGIAIFLLRKYQLILFAYFFNNQNAIFSLILVIWSISINLIDYIWLILKQQEEFHKQEDIDVVYLLDSENCKEKQSVYLEILNSFRQGTYSSHTKKESNYQITISQKNDMNLDLILQEEKVEWIVIENQIYDITKLHHPKGRYIISHCNGQDITREIYGLKSMFYQSNEQNFFTKEKMAHQEYILKHLENYRITQIPINPLLSLQNRESQIRETMGKVFATQNNKIDLFNENFFSNHINFNQQVLSLLQHKQNLVFNLDIFWLDIIGKYYLFKQEHNKIQYHYFSLALSPLYLKSKKNWLNQVESKFNTNLHKKVVNKLIENQNDQSHTNSKSIVIFTDQTYLRDFNKFYCKGPLGLGLELSHETTEKILFLIKDEGILPLLDLFELFEQLESIKYFKNKKIPHFLFESDASYMFCNEPEIYIYWEISDVFESTAQLLGLPNLRVINQIFLSDQMQLQNSPLKRALIASSLNISGQFLNQQSKNLQNFVDVEEKLIKMDINKLDRIIFSGRDMFVERFLMNSTLPFSKIKFLQ